MALRSTHVTGDDVLAVVNKATHMVWEECEVKYSTRYGIIQYSPVDTVAHGARVCRKCMKLWSEGKVL